MSSLTKQFVIPLVSSYVYNFSVNWGDGNTERVSGTGLTNVTHTYNTVGNYDVSITEITPGGFPTIKFNDRNDKHKIKKIKQFGNVKFLSFNSSFWGCTGMDITATDSSIVNTNEINDFSFAFANCTSLSSFPAISTPAATSFTSTWQDCTSLSSFPLLDVSKVTNFNSAWRNCNKLTSFPAISTPAATNMNSTWFNCSSLSSFPLLPDVSKVTNFNFTWQNCRSLSSFPVINTPDANNMSAAWLGCTSLSSFPLLTNVAKVTSFSSAWQNCESLSSFPLLSDVSKAVFFSSTWRNCNKLTSFPAISTPAATSFTSTWYECSSLSSFPLLPNVSKVTNFNSTWRFCRSLTSFPAISTPAATSMYRTWQSCISLTSFPLLPDISKVKLFDEAWTNCSSLTSFPAISTPAATDMNFTWENCTSLSSFPLLPDVSKVGSFNSTWVGCSSLTSFPAISTPAALFMGAAWADCTSLSSFPLLPDVSKVTDFNNAWADCTSLTSFPAISTPAATNMTEAWLNCSSLSSFPLLPDTSKVVKFNYTWANCFKLSGINAFPANMNFSSGNDFEGCWDNVKLQSSIYSDILINLAANNPKTNVTLDGGFSTYDDNAVAARGNLVARGWLILDGGPTNNPSMGRFYTNLKAFYNFDDTILDSSSNLNHLENSGGFSFDTGKVGNKSVKFTGGASYSGQGLVYKQDLWDGTTRTTSSTISMWYKNNSALPIGTDDIRIFFGGWVGSGTKMLVRLAYSYKTGKIDATYTDVRTETIDNFASGVWYHLVSVYDALNKSVTLYVNGSEVLLNRLAGYGTDKFLNWPQFPSNYEGGFGVGASKVGSLNEDVEFGDACNIDSLGIWTRKLTNSEIKFLYNDGIGRQYPFSF